MSKMPTLTACPGCGALGWIEPCSECGYPRWSPSERPVEVQRKIDDFARERHNRAASEERRDTDARYRNRTKENK